MTIEEIRKNAPQGATHYIKPLYYKMQDKVWYFFDPTIRLWFRSLSQKNANDAKKTFNPTPL